jgi:hypothetical protein
MSFLAQPFWGDNIEAHREALMARYDDPAVLREMVLQCRTQTLHVTVTLVVAMLLVFSLVAGVGPRVLALIGFVAIGCGIAAYRILAQRIRREIMGQQSDQLEPNQT